VNKLAPFGIVQHFQRYRGTIRQDMDLSDFPFDHHRAYIKFADYNMGKEKVRFVDFTDSELMKKVDEQTEKLDEWSPTGKGEIGVGIFYDDCDISEVTISMPLKRNSQYYFRNIVSTIYCLNILSWGIFQIPAADFGDRLNMFVTLFLALVAFAFIVSENMPKVSHSTPLTNYLTFNYLVVSFSALESWLASVAFKYFPEQEDFLNNLESFIILIVVIVHTISFAKFYFLSTATGPKPDEAKSGK